MRIKIGPYTDDGSERDVSVEIDNYDTFSLDHTLAHIILPALKEFRKHIRGAPFVDDEDVPERLQSKNDGPKENEWDLDENHFKRWDWIIDQMIFSFETKEGILQDWEDQFWEYEPEVKLLDEEGQKEFREKINRGFRLFGKYYEHLWT